MKGLANFIIGEHLGDGFSRDVYIYTLDDTLVIKVAKGFDGIAANINEFQLWDTCQYGSFYANLKDWLAPCKMISECGRYLLMARTEPVPLNKLPKVVPSILTDVKRSNIGMLNGRVVFHDYGHTLSIEEAIDRKKAKLVGDWR